MNKNMNTLDRVLRVAVAIVLVVLTLNGTIGGALAYAAWAVAAIFALTSVVSFCPLYRIFGISTCRTN